MWIHESIMASLYHYFKRDSAVHGALSSSVLLLPLIHGQQQSLRNWSLLQNRDQHHFQEPRRLCRYGDPSHSFHKRTNYTCGFVRQGFYLLKLEVGSKIVVICENLNSRILQNLTFRKYIPLRIFPGIQYWAEKGIAF